MSLDYYIIERAAGPADSLIINAKYPSILGELMLKGEDIAEKPQIDLFFDKKPISFPDLLSGVMPLPIISSRFKSLIELSGDANISFFEASLFYQSQNLRSDYWYMHIQNNIEAFDWEKSDYVAETWDSQSKKIVKWTPDKIRNVPEGEIATIDSVKKFILKDGARTNRSIYRVNAVRTFIFCNTAIKDAIVHEDLRGIYIADPLNYNSWRV